VIRKERCAFSCTVRSIELISTCVVPHQVEYLGGIVDFTGELGRYAVSRATQREADEVQSVLDVDSYVGGGNAAL
jgi:predicted translin family RNA/ssDNA-binding protein